jgi:hypothetical protein
MPLRTSVRSVSFRSRRACGAVSVVCVEWALQATDTEALAALRREIVGYLRRHAEPGSDISGVDRTLETTADPESLDA